MAEKINLTPKEEKAFKEFLDKRDGKTPEHRLILYNDNVNSVYHVIQCLVFYLKYEPMQAEQCALVAHLKGKCDIKNGSFDELKRFHNALSEKGLTVSID